MKTDRLIYLPGERVSLAVPERQDIEIFWRMSNSPEIMRTLGTNRVMLKEEKEKWYDATVESKKEFFSAILNETQEVIGLVGFAQSGSHDLFISMTDPKYLSKGYGTEIMRLFLKYAFEIRGMHKVSLGVISENIGGIKSYLKCGFTQIGIQKKEHFDNGNYQDMILMELLKEEYFK